MKLSESISGTAEKIGNFATAHQTAIEVGLSWGLFGTAALMAWFSAPKAKEELEAKKAELKADILPAKAKVLIIGKYAIRVAIPFAAACVVNNDAVSHVEKNLVATTAVAEMWRNQAIDYREAAKRVVGEKKEQKIVDDMNQKRIDDNPPMQNVNIFTPKEDGTYKALFYDQITEKYFWERREKVEIAIANAYKLQDAYDEISAYDWLKLLPQEVFGNMRDSAIDKYMNMGWSRTMPSDGFHVDIVSGGIVRSGEYEGYPCLELQYDELPIPYFRPAY